MATLEQMVLSNALTATALAMLAVAVGLVCRRPALLHGLWILVLLKLVTPPIYPVEIFHLSAPEPTAAMNDSAILSDAEKAEQPANDLLTSDLETAQTAEELDLATTSLGPSV